MANQKAVDAAWRAFHDIDMEAALEAAQTHMKPVPWGYVIVDESGAIDMPGVWAGKVYGGHPENLRSSLKPGQKIMAITEYVKD